MKYKNRSIKGNKNVPLSYNIKKINTSYFENKKIKFPKRKRPIEYITYIFKLENKQEFEYMNSFLEFIKLKYSKKLILNNKFLLDINYRKYISLDFNDHLFNVETDIVDSCIKEHINNNLIIVVKKLLLPIIIVKVNKFKIKIDITDAIDSPEFSSVINTRATVFILRDILRKMNELKI